MKRSQETKNKMVRGFSNSNSNHLSKEHKTLIWKDICTPTFIVQLSTICTAICADIYERDLERANVLNQSKMEKWNLVIYDIDGTGSGYDLTGIWMIKKTNEQMKY